MEYGFSSQAHAFLLLDVGQITWFSYLGGQCFSLLLFFEHPNALWLAVPRQHFWRGALRQSTETLDLRTSLRLSESLADDMILTMIMYEASLWVIALQLIILRRCLEGPRPRMAKINRGPFLHDAEWVSVSDFKPRCFSSKRLTSFFPTGSDSQLVGSWPKSGFWLGRNLVARSTTVKSQTVCITVLKF